MWMQSHPWDQVTHFHDVDPWQSSEWSSERIHLFSCCHSVEEVCVESWAEQHWKCNLQVVHSTGALKMADMKMTDQIAGHENAGHEIARHDKNW